MSEVAGKGKFFVKATLKAKRDFEHEHYRDDQECEANELFLCYDAEKEGWKVMKADKGQWPNSNEILPPQIVDLIFFNFKTENITKRDFFAELL